MTCIDLPCFLPLCIFFLVAAFICRAAAIFFVAIDLVTGEESSVFALARVNGEELLVFAIAFVTEELLLVFGVALDTGEELSVFAVDLLACICFSSILRYTIFLRTASDRSHVGFRHSLCSLFSFWGCLSLQSLHSYSVRRRMGGGGETNVKYVRRSSALQLGERSRKL